MAKRTKVTYEGRKLDGQELDFESEKEQWNTYKTEDGATIRLKVIVSKIVRTDEYNPETGEPIYVLLSTNISFADVPDKLKKPKKRTTKE